MAAALLGAVVAGWLAPERTSTPQAADLVQTRSAEPSAPSTPPETRAPAPRVEAAEGGAAPDRPRQPTRLSVPALGLELPVQARGVDDRGGMALPETPFAAAWYRFGPAPLDAQGATVIAGHVDTAEEGIGPLAGLSALRPGQSVIVEVGRERVRYEVEEVRQVDKAVVDLDALFARGGPPRLHLVTCGGEFSPESGGYQANIVVVARRL